MVSQDPPFFAHPLTFSLFLDITPVHLNRGLKEEERYGRSIWFGAEAGGFVDV